MSRGGQAVTRRTVYNFFAGFGLFWVIYELLFCKILGFAASHVRKAEGVRLADTCVGAR